MVDHPGLLEAIIAAPDDDVPRLIYADWLEDQGQSERAGFIRAQVAEDRYWVRDPHGMPILGRDHTHLRPEIIPFVIDPQLALGGAEVNPEDEDGERLEILYYFRRGFIEAVVTGGPRTAEWLVGQAPFLFCRTPLQLLRLALFEQFTQRPLLSTSSLLPLLSLPSISRLRTLDLGHWGMGDSLAEALLASSLTPRTRLFLVGNRLSPDACRALEVRFGESVQTEYPDDDSDEIPF